MRLQLQTLLLLLMFFFSGFAQAKQIVVNDNPLTAEVRDSQILVSPGKENNLDIRLKLADGYHAYLERFKVVVREPQEIKVTRFEVSPVVKFMDTVSKSMKDGVKDQALLQAHIMVPADFGSGVTPLLLELTYQACREEHCLFPKTISVRTQLNTSGSVGASRSAEKKKDDLSFASKVKEGLFGALLLAFLFGLGTALTPCIYPMIPITLAVLGTRKAEQSHFRKFLLALSYVFGIAITYSVLGVIAASTGGAFGRALGNIYFVSVIAGVFALMGLSMYGLIEIQMPQSIQTRLGFGRGNAGFFGAFTAGLAAGVVASPCVGPVLISILTYIAQTQNLVLGFTFLFVFAFGMGLPFLVLGTFTQLISKIPKAGSWMEFIKFIFGTLMIGMGFYYVSPLYPHWLFNLLVGLALIFISSLYGAFEPASKMIVDPEAPITAGGFTRIRKGFMIAVLVTGIGFFAHGLMTRAGVRFAVSGNNSDEAGETKVAMPKESSGLPFEAFSMDKLYIAQKEHKPVLIDFRADWCAACGELDEKTFTDARVRDLGSKFALLRFDATEDNADVSAILKEFNVIGLPTLVFFDASGRQRDDERVTGFEEADVFVKRMQKILK